ncbi:hypothetical protein FPOAC2_07110 [Fusarium poae]|jgi:hypothetical protein
MSATVESKTINKPPYPIKALRFKAIAGTIKRCKAAAKLKELNKEAAARRKMIYEAMTFPQPVTKLQYSSATCHQIATFLHSLSPNCNLLASLVRPSHTHRMSPNCNVLVSFART